MALPADCSVLNTSKLHATAVVRLAYSPSGTKLAAASQDTTISLLKTPIIQNQLDVTSLQGHNGAITSISFSSNDQFLLSSSADKSCIVWNMKPGKKGEKLLTLDRVNRPRVSDMTPSTPSSTAASATSSGSKQQNPEFADQIRQAQFYNDDKIIVVASGNKLYFY
mmetsp:Transcript_1773/g.2528  ORF Transcript_1773/g.2528 Transcript_1773/m.2528 type:complete len:166 (+) Transcript_1773:1969-2466(+)|eukprot:CAMPEP_0170453970 /NCGR_PEP_ID=MMETSP0123-20130129/2384_1 /TAXON_ID=182087 /ORGANISM="Favella ehrenbergii, Strain Fehren 1" /LENGTH=165 /DNA_ID=CAMNT_0010716539 /DNA_START=1878 /DNA_END=2375 /DNA_ORIENTATION=-